MIVMLAALIVVVVLDRVPFVAESVSKFALCGYYRVSRGAIAAECLSFPYDIILLPNSLLEMLPMRVFSLRIRLIDEAGAAP